MDSEDCLMREPDGDVTWPIVLFERDLYPVCFESMAALRSSALGREMPDEVVAGFDACRRVVQLRQTSEDWALVSGAVDETRADLLSRTALIAYWKESRLRRSGAKPEQVLAILQMTSKQVRETFAHRFGL